MGEIKKQSISNTILSYIGALIGFVSLIYVQPYFLGSQNMGLLKLIYNFSWMVAMVMPLGMGNVTMRFFPKFKNTDNVHNGYFSLLLMMVSIGALLMFIGFVSFKNSFINYYSESPKFVDYYYYCFVFAYVLALISVYNIYCSSLLKTAFTVFLTDIYTKLAFIVVVFLFYFKVIDEFGLVISYLLIHFIQLLLLIIYLCYLKAISFKINWTYLKTLDKKIIFTFAVIMTFTSFASLGIKFIDGLILGHFLDLKIIGVYSVCAFIPTILEIPFNSLERIAQPKVAHAWHIGDVAEVNKIYEMSSRYLFFIGAVLFCCLIAAADFIFMTLPPEYEAGRQVFLIMSFSSLFNLLTGVNTTVISLSRKYYINSILLIVLIGVGIFANMLLIPIYGIKGAAMATFMAIGLFNLLKYIYILYRFKMQPFSKYTIYVLTTTVFALLIIVFLPNTIHPMLKAFLGGLVTVVLFSLMNIKFGIIEEINKVFKRFNIIK